MMACCKELVRVNQYQLKLSSETDMEVTVTEFKPLMCTELPGSSKNRGKEHDKLHVILNTLQHTWVRTTNELVRFKLVSLAYMSFLGRSNCSLRIDGDKIPIYTIDIDCVCRQLKIVSSVAHGASDVHISYLTVIYNALVNVVCNVEVRYVQNLNLQYDSILKKRDDMVTMRDRLFAQIKTEEEKVD